MKRAFGHRVIVVGFIASIIANAAWAGIAVSVNNPPQWSVRFRTSPVNGSGTVAVVMDDVNNWSWKFGFGQYAGGQLWVPQVEETVSSVTATSWAKTLTAPPWNPSEMGGNAPDYTARVTLTWIWDANHKKVFDSNYHTVRSF